MGRKNSRCNLAGVVSLSVLFCIVSLFMIVDASHQSKRTQRRESLDNNRVTLSAGNFLAEWNVDKNSGSIEFILNVTVDEKGWIFFGFMPISINSSTKPSGIEDSTGDFVVTWLLPASNDRETLDLNTIKKKGELGIDTDNNYGITAGDSKKNSSVQVLHITRKLDTGDPQDVPITNQPMWMFAAWGTSEEFTKNFTTIKDNITNSLVVVKVVFLKRISIETNGNKVSWKVLKEQMKKHWVGVVVGVSALLTMVIVAAIYLCTSRGKTNAKKIKMTLYKEDEDDEARVAFLHSRT